MKKERKLVSHPVVIRKLISNLRLPAGTSNASGIPGALGTQVWRREVPRSGGAR